MKTPNTSARTTRTRPLFCGIATAGLALALSLPLAACAPNAPSADNSITVTSSAKVQVVPDTARITVGITTQGNDAAAAQKANVAPTNAVIDRLKDLGVDEEDIQTTYTDLSPVYTDEGASETYEMRTMLTVDGLAIEDVSSVMDSCVEAGATEVSGPEYYMSSYDESYQQALEQAVEAAKPKAETLAEASGVNLGDVVAVNENSQDRAIAYGSEQLAIGDAVSDEVANIEPGQLDVEAEVTVSYAIR